MSHKVTNRIDQKRLLFIKAVSIFILFVNYFLGHPVHHLLSFIKVWKTGDRLIFCLLKASNNWAFPSWGEGQKRQDGPCRRHLCWPCSRRRWWEDRESKEVDLWPLTKNDCWHFQNAPSQGIWGSSQPPGAAQPRWLSLPSTKSNYPCCPQCPGCSCLKWIKYMPQFLTQ